MPVHQKTIEALREALDDEYRSRAAYRSVIEAFGPVRPFVNIVEAEERHVDALSSLLERFGVKPPADNWAGRVPTPPSLAEACRAAVKAEIENAAMYDRLIARIDDPSAREVMRRLQRASQERHLPALQRCLEGESRLS
jgi:rubrerythrin